MEPEWHEGDVVVFDPDHDIADGADCYIEGPDFTTFKRVFFEGNGRLRLESRNPEFAPVVVEEKDLITLAVAIGYCRALPPPELP